MKNIVIIGIYLNRPFYPIVELRLEIIVKPCQLHIVNNLLKNIWQKYS